MEQETLNKTEQYLKTLSDKELSTLVQELEGQTFDESALFRTVVSDLFGHEVGIFVLRVNELIYPLLKEIHSRWTKH